MAFQLVDDLLDFVATSAQLGKPAAADLRLGLATAPVLFAARKVIAMHSTQKWSSYWWKWTNRKP